MWQKSVIFGALLAGGVFLFGWGFRLATMRILVIRSLLTATGTILTIILARKAIDLLTSTEQNVDVPLNDLNLGEFLQEDEVAEPAPADEEPGVEQSSADSSPAASPEAGTGEEMDDADLQEALEEEVDEGNEEGVEQIADLISDSMDEEN